MRPRKHHHGRRCVCSMDPFEPPYPLHKLPITLSSLQLNDISLLHLPAECFIENQLRAQQMSPDRFVATAAYGDGGPWYIPPAPEYACGGYEVSVAFCDLQIDKLLTGGMNRVLAECRRSMSSKQGGRTSRTLNRP